MKVLITIIAFIIFLSVPSLAQQIDTADIGFDVQNNLNVKETIKIIFSSNIENNFVDFVLDKGASEINVMDSARNLNYEILQRENDYLLRIYLQGDNELRISYTSSNFIFTNNNLYQFFTEISFLSGNINAKLILPPGYVIDDYSPKDGIISSDGRRISINWSLTSSESIFSVKFSKSESQDYFVFAAIFLVALIIVLVLYFRKKMKQQFIQGFREDEKKVIEYLQQNKIAYQNKVEQEFKFSRAKMTRIVKILADKGLIEKKKKGRTNKLRWIK